jgi:NAD(P)-dependent dehydrogenase (short-subunit alcohol dehydrogenase family)
VNNAGITSNPRVRSHELPIESWDRVVSVNLRGTWLCQRAILGQMMKQQRELETRYICAYAHSPHKPQCRWMRILIVAAGRDRDRRGARL